MARLYVYLEPIQQGKNTKTLCNIILPVKQIKIISPTKREFFMNGLMNANVAPILSIIAGILILVYPRILNYVVAIYLILIGLMGFVA